MTDTTRIRLAPAAPLVVAATNGTHHPLAGPRVVIATILGPEGATGVQTHVREVHSYLQRAGREVTIVHPRSHRATFARATFAARVPLSIANQDVGIAWYRESHRRFLQKALSEELREDDVIYAQCPLAARAALDARVHPRQRVVMAVHFEGSQADEWVDKEVIREGGRVYRKIRAFERLTIPHVDGIVFMSASALAGLRRYGLGLDNAPWQLLPNFSAAPAADAGTARRSDLVTVGGLEVHKNHRYLLHVLAAANRLGRRYTVDIVGDGPTRRSLVRLTRELGLEDQVHLLGCVPRAASTLPGHRAYVHTATREVLPFAVLEALAAGLPIVAGRTGGIAEMIEDGSEGVFWPLDDADAAARALIELLDDEPRRAALGRAAKARFDDRFDAAVVGPVIEDFLVNGRRRPPRQPPPSAWPVDVAPHAADGGAGFGEVVVDAEPPDDEPPRARVSRRVAITTIDQAFSSASNFAVGVVVERVAGLAGLGAFAVAYTAWLALGTAHRALITDPMSIDNDALHHGASARLTAGVAAETLLGVLAAIALAIVSIPLIAISGAHAFGVALLTLAPFLPFLLVQDYWRWVGFMQARPGRSLANDAVYNCVQALGIALLIVAGLRGPEVAIVAWGVGAAVGACYGLRQFHVRFTTRGGFDMIRSRWSMSKWFLAGGLASWGSAQAYPLLAGPAVGPVGLGGLKAAQNLMSGPTLVLIQAGGSIGLPEASRSLEQGGWPRLRRVAAWVTLAGMASVGLVAAVVFFEGGRILQLVYRHDAVKYATTARIIALAWLVQTLGLGPILVLKATKQARALFNIALASVIAACVLVPICSFVWGVNGTAWALVVSAAVTAWVEIAGYRRTARAFAADPAAVFEHEMAT